MKTKFKIGTKVGIKKSDYDTHLHLIPQFYEIPGTGVIPDHKDIAILLGDYCGKFPMIGKITKPGSDKDVWGVKFTSELGSFHSFYDEKYLVKI